MKNDRAFLAGMWQKVDLLEDEEREKAGALRRSRRLVRRWTAAALAFAAWIALLIAACLNGCGVVVYYGALAAMLLGRAADLIQSARPSARKENDS